MECNSCGRNDGTHAPGCFRCWTAENASPTYEELAAENADLRRKLAECQAQLAAAVVLPPPTCGDRGFAGRSACHLPAGHDGPHEYRTFLETDEEAMRKLSFR